MLGSPIFVTGAPCLRALRARSINPFASWSGNRKRQEPSDDGVMEIPLVHVYITNWKITMLLMGKSTISTGQFSRAMLVYQRVMCTYI